MRPAVKSRRGMTLAEILVALGVVLVMITMVISFVLLITNRTRANSVNLTYQQDFTMVKSCVEGWMNAVHAGELETENGTEDTIDATAVKAVVDVADGVQTLSLRFRNGVLVGQLEEGILSAHTQTVTSVTFLLEEKDGEKLLFCNVIGEDPDNDNEWNYTFCVNPRVGEPGGAA